MKKAFRFFMIISGSLLMALGLDLFLVPAKIAPGGVSGLSTVIHYVTGLPVGVLILLINIPIFILGARSFSKKFIFESFIGMIVLSFFVSFFEFLAPITDDLILSSVFGGVFIGAGVGLVFRSNATTGGTDIVVFLLKKRFKSLSAGNIVAIIDLLIVLLAGIVFRTWESVLYSTVSLIVSSFIIDAIIEGVDYAKAVFIISDNPDEISRVISDKLYRGTTCFCGFSHYTGKEKNTLLCVVRRFEISRLKNIIYEADKNAFVIVTDTKEVLGNGFKNY